jgi:hypothetical protein
MSEFGMAKEPETGRVEEQKTQTPKIEEKKKTSSSTTTAKPAGKSDNDRDPTASSSSSSSVAVKTLQSLQKQISQIDEVTNDAGKHLKMVEKIQVQLSQLEKRMSLIERTSEETLSIVQRIKIKKKKGKKNNKK